MARAMRTCATAAAATPLALSRIASAANRRALPPISLRPANGRASGKGVSSSSSSASISDSQTAVVVASPPGVEQDSAAEVVRRFYGGINGQDISAVEGLIADKCVYEDLIFPRPFVGREAILNFFKKFNDIMGSDLCFVVDDISEEDSSGVGITWHLEWKGKPFPFSKGCSSYRLEVIDGKRQIIIASTLAASFSLLSLLPDTRRERLKSFLRLATFNLSREVDKCAHVGQFMVLIMPT